MEMAAAVRRHEDRWAAREHGEREADGAPERIGPRRRAHEEDVHPPRRTEQRARQDHDIAPHEVEVPLDLDPREVDAGLGLPLKAAPRPAARANALWASRSADLDGHGCFRHGDGLATAAPIRSPPKLLPLRPSHASRRCQADPAPELDR